MEKLRMALVLTQELTAFLVIASTALTLIVLIKLLLFIEEKAKWLNTKLQQCSVRLTSKSVKKISIL